MPGFLLTVALVGLLTYVYSRIVRGIDRYEKEPTRYLVAAFVWGAAPAVILGIVVQLTFEIPTSLILGEDSLGSALFGSAIVAPVTEEMLKGLAVAIIYLARRSEFDGWVDGIIYGATVGFGFAFVENVLYLTAADGWGEWLRLFILRVVVFGFMHGYWTALTGIGFGVARGLKSNSAKLLAIGIGLSAAIWSHLVHNGALVLVETSGGGTFLIAIANYAALSICMIALSVAAAHNDRQIMRVYLADEVPGVISPQDYEVLSQTRTGARARLRLMSKQRRRFIQTAAELAQKRTTGPDGRRDRQQRGDPAAARPTPDL